MSNKRECYIGFDLGGTKMLACVVNQDFEIVSKSKKKTKAEKGQEEGLKRVEKCINSALEDAGIEPDQLLGIGFGLPGVLDLKEGRIVRLMNVGWEDVPMRKHFGKIYGCPVA
ncbi:MAG: ROK family protein, partial [Candidatus Sumerlaeota bacterium]